MEPKKQVNKKAVRGAGWGQREGSFREGGQQKTGQIEPDTNMLYMHNIYDVLGGIYREL